MFDCLSRTPKQRNSTIRLSKLTFCCRFFKCDRKAKSTFSCFFTKNGFYVSKTSNLGNGQIGFQSLLFVAFYSSVSGRQRQLFLVFSKIELHLSQMPNLGTSSNRLSKLGFCCFYSSVSGRLKLVSCTFQQKRSCSSKKQQKLTKTKLSELISWKTVQNVLRFGLIDKVSLTCFHRSNINSH